MLLFAAAALLSLQAAPDTLRAAPPPRADAYHDAAAGETVRLARERREGTEHSIRRYRALSKSRISLGMRALRRERLFYRCESAVRIDWRSGEPAVVEVLGAREVLPMVSARPEAEDGGCGGSVFDPAEDRLSFAAGGLVGGDSAFVRHPLAPGSEADYRFRLGDTTRVRLPGGPTLRLVELQVIPRRSASNLVSGSLWLEGDSHAVVRAVLKLARPMDLDADDGVPGLLRPMRADLRYLTVEYGLWQQRWWLPRMVALEGEAQVGRLGTFPLRVEQVYSEFEVEGDASGIPVARGVVQAPRECRGGSPRAAALADSLRAEGREVRVKTGCSCSGGRCRETVTVVPKDTGVLLAGEHLPASIFEEGEALVSRTEMEGLLAQVGRAAPTPWQLARPEVRWGTGALDLLRYNRVEGLSVGVRAEADLGRVAADGTVRLGLADLEPNAELGVTRTGADARHRAALYRRLSTVDFSGRALGPGHSLAALLFGRDEAFYYRSLGAEVLRAPAAGGAGVEWRLFAEHQTAAEKETDFSLAHPRGSDGFPENILADRATQVGAALSWRAARGLDPTGWRGSAALSLEGEAGTFGFLRPSAALFGAAPLPGGLVGSAEVATGTSLGEVPAQGLWFLGGPATLRGYRGGAAVGEAFWRARAEVGTAGPGARVVAFSDAGWAGARDAFRLDPPLLSAGAGASFLDGLVRVDLARVLRESRESRESRGWRGWRLEAYVDAAL